jgi:8-amino-7-oxononanoate synthase
VSKNLFASLQAELDQRAADGLSRRRRLLDSAQDAHIKADGREVLSFCSNDYLGFANHPQLIAALQEAAAKAGVGSGASHLITGHHRYHHELEQALASFVGLPAALLFSTGYMANLGVIPALMGRNDAIFSDKLNHASLNDASVLSRAELNRYPHNDLAALEKMLRASHVARKLVVADAVFSMDGDIAPVPELLALCEQYDAWLMLDDAHGFGVLGEKGRGVLSHFQVVSPRIIYMATLGKAAGVSGAFVAGEPVLIDYLIQNARTYVYTTATPPALSATLLAALKIIEQEDSRREHLNQLINLLKSNLRLQRWQLMDSSTAIQPVIIGSNEDVLRLSEYLLTQGILVPAIRPPTVPKGSARLRISLSAAHSVDDVQRLITAMQSAEKVMAI